MSNSKRRTSFSMAGVGRALEYYSPLGPVTVRTRRWLWAWPIVAFLALVALGVFLKNTVGAAMRREAASVVTTLLNTQTVALRIWFNAQEAKALAVTRDPHVRDYVMELLTLHNRPDSSPRSLLDSPALQGLRESMTPFLETHRLDSFAVITPERVVLACPYDEVIGKPAPASDGRRMTLEKALAGQATIMPPFKSTIMVPDIDGEIRAGVPVLHVAAPVFDADDRVVALFLLLMHPEGDFSRVLAAGRTGTTGETYAFDGSGLMISESRYDDQLKQLGLLVDAPGSRAVMNLELRDPGVDMTRGLRPALRRQEQPLTRMAQDALKGNSGVDVEGYRSYRGVPVIGAWTWFSDYDIGLATEVEYGEAYQPLTVLRRLYVGLFVLLVIGVIAVFVFSIIAARSSREARRAVVQARKLGQYTLDEKVGAGGMGTVYRAHHAMLRRPTAVKLLDVERMTHESIIRFEREVDLTSQLNHPNTISVYDFGRTPEGVFYYAMEYLDGMDLQNLVDRFGEQPEARVIHILLQVCGSLTEAHEAGLIHRDIKPANIILNRRAGLCDFVKVLDFGLVKAVGSESTLNLTGVDSWVGTPMYASPESIAHPETIDARSDLYSVGAVGYYLVTGKPLFSAHSFVEICRLHLEVLPEPPSRLAKAPLSADFEAVLMACLAKDPNERPATAAELARRLAACASADSWTEEDGQHWWDSHQPSQSARLLNDREPLVSPDPTVLMATPPDSRNMT